MENLKNILNSFSEDDYKNNKINLHIHTSHSDGLGDVAQVVKSAKEKGYRLIAITDHNTIEAHKRIKDEILLTGVEFDCWFGTVFIHLLAYGIDIYHPDIQPFLAMDKKGTEDVLPRLFSKRNVKKLIEAIHNAGGVSVLAHPACYWAFSLEKLVKNLIDIGLDGIEIYYPYPHLRSIVKFHSEKRVLQIAEKYPQLIKTGGTDFHEKEF